MRRAGQAAALLSLAWLAACASATSPAATATAMPATAMAADTTTTPAPTAMAASTATAPSATLAATAAASPTGPAANLFRLVPDVPVLKANFGWARTYLDPGAVVYHDGQYHMFFNGIESWPAPVGVGYATSPDGLQWTVQGAAPVFSLGPYTNSAGYDGPNLFAQSVLVQPDGTWVMYYYNLSGSSFAGPESIGRATAASPSGPWTADPQPVLMPGAPGSWDATQVSAPNVVSTTSGYVMYYDGLSAKNASMIGMATSPDGVHWSKYDDPATTADPYAHSDPVLKPEAGTWNAKHIMDPNVIPIDGGWAMIYLSTDQSSGKFTGNVFSFGLATSPDGRTWTESPDNPILSNKGHQGWQATYLVTLVAAPDGSQQFLLFDAATSSGTNIYEAVHSGPLTLK